MCDFYTVILAKDIVLDIDIIADSNPLTKRLNTDLHILALIVGQHLSTPISGCSRDEWH